MGHDHFHEPQYPPPELVVCETCKGHLGMEPELTDGNGLSDLIDAARMAETVSEIYGAKAPMVAAYNGLSAWNDDRQGDKRLWANVLRILNS